MHTATSRRWKSIGLALTVVPYGLFAPAQTLLSASNSSEAPFLNEKRSFGRGRGRQEGLGRCEQPVGHYGERKSE